MLHIRGEEIDWKTQLGYAEVYPYLAAGLDYLKGKSQDGIGDALDKMPDSLGALAWSLEKGGVWANEVLFSEAGELAEAAIVGHGYSPELMEWAKENGKDLYTHYDGLSVDELIDGLSKTGISDLVKWSEQLAATYIPGEVLSEAWDLDDITGKYSYEYNPVGGGDPVKVDVDLYKNFKEEGKPLMSLNEKISQDIISSAIKDTLEFMMGTNDQGEEADLEKVMIWPGLGNESQDEATDLTGPAPGVGR